MRTKFLIFFITLFLSIFVFVNLVFAQWGTGDVYPQVKSWFAFTLGVPEEWVEWPAVFWLIILPYASTLAILFGLLEEIGIFRRAAHKTTIYLTIAAGWAMFLIPTGFLGLIASGFYTIGAALSIIIFVFAFGIGVALWAYTFTGGWRSKGTYTQQLLKSRESYHKELAIVQGQMKSILRSAVGGSLSTAQQTQLDKLRIREIELKEELRKIKDAIDIV